MMKEYLVRKENFLAGMEEKEREQWDSIEKIAVDMYGVINNEIDEVGKYIYLIRMVFKQLVVTSHLIGGITLTQSVFCDVMVNLVEELCEYGEMV